MPKKPFHEIETDAEYLRDVGMGPETHPELYDVWHKSGCGLMSLTNIRASKRSFYAGKEVSAIHLGLHDTDPARKWRNFANAIIVFGPEMDRRGWGVKMNIFGDGVVEIFSGSKFQGSCNLPHLAVLEAFYNAHAAQGDEA